MFVFQRPQPVHDQLWGDDDNWRPYGLDPGQGPRPGSLPLSVCIITLNEEAGLADCLASVAFAQDVVVVDACSSDRTAEIARAAGARVFVRPWPGFTAQRNFALECCRFPWVLSVDADERASLRLARALERLLASPPDRTAYRVPEVNRYFGRWLVHGGLYPGFHVSLFDRREHRYESPGGDVHEDVRVPEAGELDGHILHLAYSDFRTALRKLNHYTDLEAQGRHRPAGRHSPYHMVRRALGRFLNAYLLRRGFLDGIPGFLYACLYGLYAFCYTVKMWELDQTARPAPPPAEGRETSMDSAA